MAAFRARVAAAIARDGFLCLTVLPGPTPTWRYTIGLTEAGLPEVLVAGSSAYTDATLDAIVQTVAERMRAGDLESDARGVLVDGVEFDLRPVHPSWTERLLLQAVEYYEGRVVTAVQAVPSAEWADVPDASAPYVPDVEPVWQWLDEDWDYPCDERVRVFADVDVLRGLPVVEVIHASEPDGTDWWAMRIGEEEVTSEDWSRLVPMGTLLALDPSLAVTLDLKPGEWATYDDVTGNWLTREI